MSSHRVASWLAWSLAALSFVLCGVSLVLYISTRSVEPPSTWGTGGVSAVFVFMVPFLAFPLVGALIASRLPRNPIGWICLGAGTFWMLSISTGVYGVYGLVAKPGSVPFPAAMGSLTEWLWVPTLGLLGIYLVLLFPDGKLPSRRWRSLVWFSGAVILLASVSIVLAPGRLVDLGGIRNPFGLEEYPRVAGVMGNTLLLLPLCMLASAVSLVSRYRRSGREQRQQIKWVAYAAALVASGFVVLLAAEGLFAPDEGSRPLWGRLLEDAVTVSYAGVPIAMGFAVLRYRLYDIDLLVNRTLVYMTLTASLAGVYLTCVVVLQQLFHALTGTDSQLAVVASTLAIAALFNPLRGRIQSFIDLSFYRNRYDGRKTMEEFGERLREETELERVGEHLESVVVETMQPASISLWLRPSRGASKAEPTNRQSV